MCPVSDERKDEMSDPYRIELTEFHSGFRAAVRRPRRTLLRKRLVYGAPFHWTTTRGGTDARRSAISGALSVIPKAVEYEIVEV